MQGPCQAVQARREGEIGIAQCTPHQVGCMSTNVATLVIRVDGLVETHELPTLFIIVSHHSGVIGRPVQGRIRPNTHRGLSAIVAPVNICRNLWQLRDEVHGIFVHVFPVLGLVHAIEVRPGKMRAGLQGHDRRRELCHGMRIGRERLQDAVDVVGDFAPLDEFVAERFYLLLGRYVPGHEQPHEPFWQRFATFHGSREQLLALRYAVSTKSYPFVCVQEGSFPQHAFDSSHSAE
mmetsp:Transcript_11507/g.70772  ORF Transcript_11507/g.70772 Transcript_11507/m.70772 type:complete len:235 (-) Transcript_11507:94-798(-)